MSTNHETLDAASVLDAATVLVVGAADWTTTLAAALEERTAATVERATANSAALDVLESSDVDAVVTENALEDGTGIELLRAVRDRTATLPVLLGAENGSEALASEATAAGVTGYVAVDAPSDAVVDDVLERTDRAIRAARRSRTRRDRARQFDAIFHDDRTATWVLAPDGTLERVNQTAREVVDADVDDIVGEPLWTLPWWTDAADDRADVRRIVETALGGSFGHAVVLREGVDGGRVVELSARPVTDERGRLVSVVVEGVDISERVDLERDLRRSEELHRVTLNNMTDTVLITDEDGEYTYVCPNAHFIFGYGADEIRDLGGIDALLGEDLFDREELAETGVLKNIECTAIDKAGREHTLLVNVREVSIQDGRLLYSCRDITKRKQREEALATLQETARDFLYAGTHREIAQQVVDDAASVLDLDASAVYLFDAEENHLEPAAYSQGMREAHGPLPTVHADGRDLTSYSFVEDESLFFDDVHDADRLANPATELRSTTYIPLGSHGVFVAGSTDVGAFDDVARELADLLAATAEAALDRVSRESRLREQDRELQARNDELTALNRINETIREIDQALVRAETREEIDHTVCDLLTADDRFRFAWVGSVDGTGDVVEPRAWAGADEGYLDAVSFDVDAHHVEPAGRTAATQRATKVSNVATDLRVAPWRKDALARDFLSVLSIPLAYDDVTHGVLTVYAETPDAFDETIRTVLEELAETIAAAISASERKRALLTTSMTRVEFAVEDRSFVLAALARAADCTVTYEGGVQQTATGTQVFVTVEDAPVDDVVAAARDVVGVDDVHRMAGGETGGVLRLGLSRPFVAAEFADYGAVVSRIEATAAGTTLTVDVPESVDVRRVTRVVEERFDDAELASKQTRSQASEHGFYATVLDRLTDRQLEVLETAYYSGFFESPRQCTGDVVADSLGISPQAFYQHVRTVQRKLFAALVDDHVPVSPPASA
ncbi:GAF domain-containing protein [Halorubellus sp. JP-L1]|uniref:bacterio-opsin activator domain-containing protein n=1 Tax=Halorubellus sp. JP-L1 TaxID=2715753 RepID=UPI001407929B|nr:bacterio-opsin activator domain-containing protein [Halorubellus sp. JP-L1]NHN41685.1 GAF domain-containing protein [Halorubellus sp. JP-L1]